MDRFYPSRKLDNLEQSIALMNLAEKKEFMDTIAEIIQDHRLLAPYLEQEYDHAKVVIHEYAKNIVFTFQKEGYYYACKILVLDPTISTQRREVELASYLTRRFYDSDLVPSICPILHLDQGDDLGQLLAVRGKCPSEEEIYLQDHLLMVRDLEYCALLGDSSLRELNLSRGVQEQKRLSGKYYLMVMMHGISFAEFLEEQIAELRVVIDTPEQAIPLVAIDRVLFQLIFTLAVIQTHYPRFAHHDLHHGNILLRWINEIRSTNDSLAEITYSQYHFEGRTWQLPMQGHYGMVIDFQLSELEADPSEHTEYDNIWNLLRSIRSCLQRDLIVSAKISDLILERVDRLLDRPMMECLDRVRPVQSPNETLISLPSIRQAVKTPAQYLLEGYFDQFTISQRSDPNAVVRHHYNAPPK